MKDMYVEGASFPFALAHRSISEYSVHGELPHWHNGIELICVSQGHVRCQTNQHTFLLHKGDLCFINQKQLHRLIQSDAGDSRYIALFIGAGLLVKHPAVYDKYILPMLEEPSFSHILLPGQNSNAGKIRAALREMELYWRERPCGYELELIALCHQVFRQLYLAFIEKENAASPADGNILLLKKMIEYLAERYAENLSLADVAQAGHVSKSKCSRLFKQYTGLSPIAYLISYRLEESAAMLRNSLEPVARIAQACGFSQQSYYNRLFFREYKCTPMEYRKAKQADGKSDARP